MRISDSRVLKLAEWTIGPERDGSGHMPPPVRTVRCADCDVVYEPGRSHTQSETDQWALQHTGLTGHRRYRETVEASLVVHPAPTNPLYEKEQGK